MKVADYNEATALLSLHFWKGFTLQVQRLSVAFCLKEVLILSLALYVSLLLIESSLLLINSM